MTAVYRNSAETPALFNACPTNINPSVRRILAGLAVREVQEPLLIAGEFDESQLAECEALGLTMAAGLEAGVFQESGSGRAVDILQFGYDRVNRDGFADIVALRIIDTDLFQELDRGFGAD